MFQIVGLVQTADEGNRLVARAKSPLAWLLWRRFGEGMRVSRILLGPGFRRVAPGTHSRTGILGRAGNRTHQECRPTSHYAIVHVYKYLYIARQW